MKEVKKALLDVDFIKNANQFDMPSSYGTYQKKAEMESTTLLLKNCLLDKELKR